MNVDDLEVQPQPPAKDPREIEQVVDQPGFEFDVAAYHLESRQKRRLGFRFQKRRDSNQDRSQRGAQLMAEHRQKAILGVRRRLGHDLGVKKLFFGPFAIGDVFDDERAQCPTPAGATPLARG